MTGTRINHVPYRGGGPALNDVMTGQVKLLFSNGSAALGVIQGGKVRAICHTGKGRLRGLPDVPPASDTLPGFEAYEWNGVFVPHGTPQAIVKTLNTKINEAIGSPEVKERFEQLNIETRASTPEEFGAYIRDQMARCGKIVKEAGIRLG